MALNQNQFLHIVLSLTVNPGNVIPEQLGIFIGDRFGSGSSFSISSSYRGGGKHTNPGRAKPLSGTKSSGTLYLSNSENIK